MSIPYLTVGNNTQETEIFDRRKFLKESFGQDLSNNISLDSREDDAHKNGSVSIPGNFVKTELAILLNLKICLTPMVVEILYDWLSGLPKLILEVHSIKRLLQVLVQMLKAEIKRKEIMAENGIKESIPTSPISSKRELFKRIKTEMFERIIEPNFQLETQTYLESIKAIHEETDEVLWGTKIMGEVIMKPISEFIYMFSECVPCPNNDIFVYQKLKETVGIIEGIIEEI